MDEAGKGPWNLLAPIDGTIISVSAKPGAVVAPGDVLFRIVDTQELWIVAKVPEQDALRLRSDRDASFKFSGLDTGPQSMSVAMTRMLQSYPSGAASISGLAPSTLSTRYDPPNHPCAWGPLLQVSSPLVMISMVWLFLDPD